MLRVIVEILPGGDANRAKVLGVINVSNLSDLAEISDYDVSVFEPAMPANALTPEVMRASHSGRFSINGHKRSEGWKVLVAKVMNRLSL